MADFSTPSRAVAIHNQLSGTLTQRRQSVASVVQCNAKFGEKKHARCEGDKNKRAKEKLSSSPFVGGGHKNDGEVKIVLELYAPF
jgi:hypothetical protein